MRIHTIQEGKRPGMAAGGNQMSGVREWGTEHPLHRAKGRTTGERWVPDRTKKRR